MGFHNHMFHHYKNLKNTPSSPLTKVNQSSLLHYGTTNQLFNSNTRYAWRNNYCFMYPKGSQKQQQPCWPGLKRVFNQPTWWENNYIVTCAYALFDWLYKSQLGLDCLVQL